MIPTLEQLLQDFENHIEALHPGLKELDVKFLQLKLEIENLQKDVHFLQCLRNAGVDNWDGYSYAIEEHLKEYPDED